MSNEDAVQLLEAIQQLQDMLRARMPIPSPHFERLAEQQRIIEDLIVKYKY